MFPQDALSYNNALFILDRAIKDVRKAVQMLNRLEKGRNAKIDMRNKMAGRNMLHQSYGK